ncbi:MAG: transporter ATP-binding protein [Frondihabitans sp.]|nr:transporter ATP-binding protein [Frondihabitans sp.]
MNINCKNYGSEASVHGVSFSIETGELHGLLGPNGSGKSTVINGIAGVISLDSGLVEIAGHRFSDSAAKAQMSYVPDELPMPTSLSGNEFLDFTARLSRSTNRSWQRTLVEVFDLERHLGKFVGECSHGTKKKLQIVAAVAACPRLLILDEPFRGLDAEATETLLAILQTHRARGGAVLLATHDLSFADDECSHVTILDRGCVVASGRPDELRLEFDRANLATVFLRVSQLEDKRENTALRIASDWPA